MKRGLLAETVRMAMDTLRVNATRSALTVLGVVIGVTSIVGVTSLVRGLDTSLRAAIEELGPRTIFVARFSGMSLGSGTDFLRLLRRPNLTIEDARALERIPGVDAVDVSFGMSLPRTEERASYRGERTKPLQIIGTTENFPVVSVVKLDMGRYFTSGEVQRSRAVAVLGQTPFQVLFADRGIDPIGKTVRVGSRDYRVIGVSAPRPSPGGFNAGQDDVVIVPESAYRKQFGLRGGGFFGRRGRSAGLMVQSMMIGVLPHEGVELADAMREVETTMRIRHGLRLDEPNDFDVITQDAVLTMFDQISQATFLSLLVISSIALLVGGIGVMAIMMISVTERTREIGVRKALGARRREVLTQFLTEAAVLTSAGGLIGVVLGAALGVAVHLATGFPLSLPWWSFAIGLGFSTSVGVFFGMYPAMRAAKLDPIEALRYE